MYTIIAPDGKEHGPVDLATMQSWIAGGNVVPSSRVLDPIDGMAKPASDIPELARLFPPVSPSQPPAAPNYGTQQQVNIHVSAPAYMAAAGPPKSKLVAALLAFFLGGLGIHRFYLGHTATGVVMLIMSLLGWLLLFIPNAIVGIWALVDLILILTGGLKDNYGRELTQ